MLGRHSFLHCFIKSTYHVFFVCTQHDQPGISFSRTPQAPKAPVLERRGARCRPCVPPRRCKRPPGRAARPRWTAPYHRPPVACSNPGWSWPDLPSMRLWRIGWQHMWNQPLSTRSRQASWMINWMLVASVNVDEKLSGHAPWCPLTDPSTGYLHHNADVQTLKCGLVTSFLHYKLNTYIYIYTYTCILLLYNITYIKTNNSIIIIISYIKNIAILYNTI
jgi:hypothetical protein